MKLRIFSHFMPWEIDAALLLSEKLRRCSYYLRKEDEVQLDFRLNLSSALIDWDKSKLDKQFFLDKWHMLQGLNMWGDTNIYSPLVYEGDEMWGHLNAFRDVVRDDVECDAYCSLTPNTNFDRSLLFYMFRCMEGAQTEGDYWMINPQTVKMWDFTWDQMVNEHYASIPYNEHHLIDSYGIEKVVGDHLEDVQLLRNMTGHYKLAGWCDIHSAKLLDLVMYPDDWFGYGPMDSFYILLLGKMQRLIDKKDFNCVQYYIRNQIAQAASQFDLTRQVYENRIARKSGTDHMDQRKKVHDRIICYVDDKFNEIVKKMDWNVGEETDKVFLEFQKRVKEAEEDGTKDIVLSDWSEEYQKICEKQQSESNNSIQISQKES